MAGQPALQLKSQIGKFFEMSGLNRLVFDEFISTGFKQIKLFWSNIYLISTHKAKLRIKTNNGGQCASFYVMMHLLDLFAL